jgi:hypothetical protein
VTCSFDSYGYIYTDVSDGTRDNCAFICIKVVVTVFVL